MNEALKKSNQTTWLDFPSVTSSPGLQVGAWRLDSPDGRTTKKSELDRARASRSVPQVNKKAQKTTVTCGPNSTASLASANLTLLLANRLKAQLATDGSILYKQTWKEKVTSSGIRYWEHTASPRRTNASDYIGPQTESSAQMMGFPTASARDTKSNTATEEFHAQRMQESRGKTLNEVAAWVIQESTLSSWPRPHDTGIPLTQQVGLIQTGFTAETTTTGQLNQELSRWLMGYPEEWCSCRPNYNDWQAWRDLMGQA